MSIKCQWTQSLFFHHLIQHNPSTVLCWVVFAGPVPELYQINLDQRLGLIIIFVYLSAFFFLSNSTKQSRGFKLWKAFVEVEQWKHSFQLGLLSPSVQMGGGHGGTVPGLGSLLYCTLWFLRWWRSTWLLREWPTETFWPMHHLLQVFGDLIWTRCRSHYVLWTRPLCFEGKKKRTGGNVSMWTWIMCSGQRRALFCLIHSTGIATAPGGTRQVLCWCCGSRGAQKTQHWGCSLLDSGWMELRSCWSQVPKLLKTGSQILFLGTARGSSWASGTAWAHSQLRLHSAALICCPSGPLSQHEISSFSGL